jgi:hypothetical protein
MNSLVDAWELQVKLNVFLKCEISCFHSGKCEMATFWYVAPCSLVEVNRRFVGAYCVHNQGGIERLLSILEWPTTQMTDIVKEKY